MCTRCLPTISSLTHFRALGFSISHLRVKWILKMGELFFCYNEYKLAGVQYRSLSFTSIRAYYIFESYRITEQERCYYKTTSKTKKITIEIK